MSLTLKEHRIQLGWSRRRMAKEASLSPFAVSMAEKGETISPVTAKALADALSRAYGREISALDIKGLDVK